MLSELQRNVPLDAKFGLHFGRFAQLPTTEEFFRFQTLHKGAKYRLYNLDITPVLALIEKNHHFKLALEIPVLGFSDPILDYDINPWFAVPLAINGYVACANNQAQSCGGAVFQDLMDNRFSLKTDAGGCIDFEQMANEAKTPIFSTLKAIQYYYSYEQLLKGQGLEPLPKSSQFKGKITLCLPKVQRPFQLKLLVLNKKEICFTHKLFIAPKVETEINTNVKASWQGSTTQGELEINYSIPDNYALQQAQNATLQLRLPRKKNLKLMMAGTLDWISTSQDKNACMTQYIGLGEHAFLDLVMHLIPFDYFCEQLDKNTNKKNKGLSESINPYHVNATAKETLYQYILSGVMNRSVPLYALTDYMKNASQVYQRLNSFSIKHWRTADQIVFKNYLCSLSSNKRSASEIFDDLDAMLSFGVTSLSGTLKIKTSGATLASKPKVHANIVIEPLPQEYPLTYLNVPTQQKEAVPSKRGMKKIDKKDGKQKDL